MEYRATDITCALDLAGGDDLADDSRLDFGEGADHAIHFTAPEEGEYAVIFENDPSTNCGCGASVVKPDRVFHTAASCPTAGQTVDLDGFFSSGVEFPHVRAAIDVPEELDELDRAVPRVALADHLPRGDIGDPVESVLSEALAPPTYRVRVNAEFGRDVLTRGR